MNQEQKSRWWRIVIVTVGLLAVYVLILISIISSEIDIGSPGTPDQIDLWEWVAILIVPVALAAGGILLERAFAQREKTATEERAQDEALQRYLDQVSDLMINQCLYERAKGTPVPLLATARTTTVLLILDEKRKRRPLKLIYRLRLINKDQPLVDLENADLEQANLSEIRLSEACLKGIDLRRADLTGSNLAEADLSKADLRGANLSGASLKDACLKEANLLPYDERNPAELSKHNLEDGAALSNLDLSGKAFLRRTNLERTNLSGTILEGADLSGAYLCGALLADAKGLTQEQVDQAIGDQTTQLPGHLRHPEAWSNGTNG